MPIDEIVFCDTTKEFPAMYEHLDKLENYIRMPITRVSFDFNYWFKDHVKVEGKYKGSKGYHWPGPKNRWCTRLKQEAIQKEYAKYDEPINEYIGIAFNERHRQFKNKGKKVNCKYPLIEWGITEKQALQYCYSKGFNWDGLYKKMSRVSCYLCPFQRLRGLEVLYNDYPELWADIKRLDKYSQRSFTPDYTVEELEHKFEMNKRQMVLF